MTVLPLPHNLVAAATEQGRSEWLSTLPAMVDELEGRWEVEIGTPFQPGGQTAWVAPASTSDGRDVVVKIGWRHDEAEHEADALRLWDGDGAVRVYATAERRQTVALLLERCRPGTTLASLREPDQDEVVAGLLQRLWEHPTPGGRFRPLQQMCDEWADGFEHKPPPVGLDPGMARHAMELFRGLPATADRQVLLCTDLHAGNILAAGREPWLVIDPKPYTGDPTYDALQHMFNCEDRLQSEPRQFAVRMARLLDLDADRLLLWLFARCVQESPGHDFLVAIAGRIAP